MQEERDITLKNSSQTQRLHHTERCHSPRKGDVMGGRQRNFVSREVKILGRGCLANAAAQMSDDLGKSELAGGF